MQRYGHFSPLLMVSCALSTGIACAAHPHEADVGVSRAHVSQPIVHGRDDSTNRFDAVVMLSFTKNGTLCSGTLIAPDTVLTAAHCVPLSWKLGGGVQRLSDDQALDVVFHHGARVTMIRPARAVAVHDQFRGLVRCGHSGGVEAQRACRAFARSCGAIEGPGMDACLSELDGDVRRGLGLTQLWPTHDVALVFLKKPVAEIPPTHILDERCCAGLVHKHAPVVLAGYGQQGDTAAHRGVVGAIRHGHNHIVDVGEGELRVDGGSKTHPCFGDSGGPVFAEVDHDGQRGLVQVGVASRVWDYHVHRGCASGLAYTRVDHEGAFIGATMRDAIVEGVRRPDDAVSDPQFAAPPPAPDSCQQGISPWGCVLFLGLWLLARRGMHRAA